MARIMPGAGAAVVTGAIDSGGPAREFALASLGSRSQRKEQSMNPIERGRIAVALSLLVPATALAQATPKKPAAARPASHLVQPSDAAYQPNEVPGFPSGAKMAPIHGNPNAASGSYVVRLSFPDGYKFPAHWHPNPENVTVLEGELELGMGDKEGGATTGYGAGSFLYIPATMAHFGGAKGATVIQRQGQAPFKIMRSPPAAKYPAGRPGGRASGGRRGAIDR